MNRWIVLAALTASVVGCGRRNYTSASDGGTADGGTLGTDGGIAEQCARLQADGTVVFEGHCYAVFAGPVTFDAAQSACIALGGNLAEFANAAEESAVTTALDLGSTPWLGLASTAASSWRWLSDRPLLYTNWATPPAASGIDDRAFVGADGWAVTPKTASRGFLCEIGWTRHPDKAVEYEAFVEVVWTWQEARNLCISLDGDLAVLIDDSDYTTVTELTFQDRWVGAKDEASNGVYLWRTGVEVEAIRWQSAEPNGTGQCVDIIGELLGDHGCDQAETVLCERVAQ